VPFEVALFISLVIHLLALTVVFVRNNIEDHPVFHELKIRLQPDEEKHSIESLMQKAQEAMLPQPAANQTQDTAQEVQGLEAHQLEANEVQEASVLSPKKSEIKDDITYKANSASIAKNLSNPVKEVSPSQQVVKPQPKPRHRQHIPGNTLDGTANELSRYEQLLPLWLDRFREYPAEAIELGLEGKGIVFIKINREGKVLFASIAKSTGYSLLDDSLLAMVAQANPVLPVPQDYAPEHYEFSYQIEFGFSMNHVN
jgi:TonB family protein